MNEDTTILLNEQQPINFELYNTKDTLLSIPKMGYGVLLLIDRCINGLDVLPKLNIGKQITNIYLPKQFKVYNKQFSINRNLINSALKLNLNIISNSTSINQSFLLDISPYVSFLFSKFNVYKYSEECIKFINNTINSIKSGMMAPNIINRWIILYVIDDSFINNGKFIDKQLFGYAFLRYMLSFNSKTNILGNNINEIYLYHQSSNTSNIRKIYDNRQPVNYNDVRDCFLDIKPNLIIEEYKVKEVDNNTTNNTDNTTTNTEEDNAIQNKEIPQTKQINNDKTIFTVSSNTRSDVKLDYNKLITLAKQANNINVGRRLDSIELNVQIPEEIQKAIITKIDDQQYEPDREIPVVDDDNEKEFSKIIDPNNNKMFPFLNSTKIKNDNITDVSINNKMDRDTDMQKLLKGLVSTISKDDKEYRQNYLCIESKLEKNPDLLNKAIDLYDKKDYRQLLTYINEDHLPYASRIYPKKDEVDRNVLKDLDDWSNDNGTSIAVGADSILTSDVISNTVVSNMHRVAAQKQLTWNRMPQEIEGYIKKLLEDNGFQLIDISMIDKEPPITQIEPTYKTEIKIRIRNKNTKAPQTLVFEVPTLLEGKYHISGGIKWLFPNVVATLPIFVVRPGKVQFRSGYSSITFQHHNTSLIDSVTVYIAGITMPLLVWLLQFKSLDEIGKDLGFSHKFYETKKDAKEANFKVVLSDKKILGITINDSKNAKLIKGISFDLQSLNNKLARYNTPFDLYSYDDNSEYIQLYTNNKKNISYIFDKYKRYMIDKRTEGILKARGIEPDLYKVSLRCGDISINDVQEDRLGINNINIRLMDLIPTEIEKALHTAISEYKRRRLINPDAKLIINSGWVTNKLREQSVLQLYKDGNCTIENAQLTGVRLVGPGGFGTSDMVQNKDKNIVGDHFGTLDPVDTPEGNPGIQLSLTTGFEYDPDHKIFSQVKSNNTYKHIFGTAASQTPFISFDDGNRVQFGGSQARQAVPILNSEAPLVGTGTEAYLPNYASSKFIKRAPVDGVVTYIDDKVIIIKDQYNKSYKIDITPSNLQTGAGKWNALEHTPTVKVGDRVNRNQHLVTNQFIKPVYSAGANVLACYKPEGGYTFEDGIVVSESFASRYTSLHYQNIDINVSHISELVEFPLFKLKRDGNMEYQINDTIVKIRKLAFGGNIEDEIIAQTKCKVIDIQVFPADHSFDSLIREIDQLLYSKTNAALKSNGLSPMMRTNELIQNAGKYEFRKNKLTNTLIRIKLIEYRSIGLGEA